MWFFVGAVSIGAALLLWLYYDIYKGICDEVQADIDWYTTWHERIEQPWDGRRYRG